MDGALGYTPQEVGPFRPTRKPVAISRTQTLLAKWALVVALAPVAYGLIMLATAGILRMDAPRPVYLWVFGSCSAAVVGIGVIALQAAFGTLGQLVATVFYIVLGLPSSGGTVPLQAVPEFYRVISWFEPLRQILAGLRAILYFDARADAGLARGWLWLGIGLAAGVAFGLGVTRFYDRRRLDRIPSDELAALYGADAGQGGGAR